MTEHIILASASPRRQELLQQIGVDFEQRIADVDESQRADEPAAEYVARLALEKALAIWQHEPQQQTPVLGADTAVVIDDTVLGKPADEADCRRMLRRLSADSHQVISAVALVAGRKEVRISQSTVWFRPIADAEIDAYWRSGEPRDKAGGYAIQGLAAVFVERLEGSYSGVMGLPLFETAGLLEKFGVRILRPSA